MVNCSILSCLHVVQLLLFFASEYFYEQTTHKYYCDSILMSPRQNVHLRNSSCHDSRIVALRRKKERKNINSNGVTSGVRSMSVFLSHSVYFLYWQIKKNGTLVTNDSRPVRVTILHRKFAPVFRRVVQIRGLAWKRKKNVLSPFC